MIQITEEKLAKLAEVKKFFEIEKASQFTKEWRELAIADQTEIRKLVYIELNS